ncbi:hypothetical protein MTO96_045194 [Rhipicephalus appendiculatus]
MLEICQKDFSTNEETFQAHSKVLHEKRPQESRLEPALCCSVLRSTTLAVSNAGLQSFTIKNSLNQHFLTIPDERLLSPLVCIRDKGGVASFVRVCGDCLHHCMAVRQGDCAIAAAAESANEHSCGVKDVAKIALCLVLH